jgi:hypothetical protein
MDDIAARRAGLMALLAFLFGVAVFCIIYYQQRSP